MAWLGAFQKCKFTINFKLDSFNYMQKIGDTYIPGKDYKNDILEIIESITEIELSELTEETILLGDSAILDSMSLVELCVNLEDYANENGFQFDWTSNSTILMLKPSLS